MTPRLSVLIALASRRCASTSGTMRSRLIGMTSASALALAGLLTVPFGPLFAQDSNTTAPTTTAPASGSATAPASATTSTQSDQGSGGFDFSGSKPIDISADNGIEWRKQDKVYIARGKALAVQGNQSIAADTLTGYYSTDSNHIDRMTGDGNVVIKNGSQTAYGDHADYDTNTKLLVMKGNNLKTVTDKGDVVTARDSMEYWKDRDTIVAKGNVFTVHGDTKVHSDLANGYFHANSDGKKVLYQVEALGNVKTDTAKQTTWSDKMVYNLETKIAVFTGHVRIQQGNNTFTGDRAEINTATNVSRLLSDPGKGSGRVHTTIGPKKKTPSSSDSNTTTGGGSGDSGTGAGTTTQP
jgi:lipopolysaccharide export system protein LptA